MGPLHFGPVNPRLQTGIPGHRFGLGHKLQAAPHPPRGPAPQMAQLRRQIPALVDRKLAFQQLGQLVCEMGNVGFGQGDAS